MVLLSRRRHRNGMRQGAGTALDLGPGHSETISAGTRMGGSNPFSARLGKRTTATTRRANYSTGGWMDGQLNTPCAMVQEDCWASRRPSRTWVLAALLSRNP